MSIIEMTIWSLYLLLHKNQNQIFEAWYRESIKYHILTFDKNIQIEV